MLICQRKPFVSVCEFFIDLCKLMVDSNKDLFASSSSAVFDNNLSLATTRDLFASSSSAVFEKSSSVFNMLSVL